MSNRYTHFPLPRKNTSVDLTTTTEVRALGRSAIKCRVVGELSTLLGFIAASACWPNSRQNFLEVIGATRK